MAVRIVRCLPEVIVWHLGYIEVFQRYFDGSKDSLGSTRGSWMAVSIV